MPEKARQAFLASLTPQEAEQLFYDWLFWSRPSQRSPAGDWRGWLTLAGRGWGKTRVLCEWLRGRVESGVARHIAIVGETAADCRDVLVEGPTGILAISPRWMRPKYEPSKRRVTWPNGAVATLYSGEEPDQLRGPQHDTAIADELAKWRYAEESWDNLEFGLRMGTHPQVVVATTPRPIPIVRQLLKDPGFIVTRGSTYENAGNLAASYIDRIRRKYEGTRIGRQELYAEILDDTPGALWTRANLDQHRIRHDDIKNLPQMVRMAVAVDPAASSGEDAAENGIIAAGIGLNGHGYVFEDQSLKGTPNEWGTRAVQLYDRLGADRLVYETNQGGEMVAHVLRNAARDLHRNGQRVHPHINLEPVHASRGKQTRAEPISGLYEQGMVHHIGLHAQLEDQLCSWVANSGMPSPDRLDALVWALTFLMLETQGVGVYI